MVENLKPCDGLLLYGPSENTSEHMTMAVRGLVELCKTENDPFVLSYILRGQSSMTVAKEEASGKERSQKALSGILTQLDQCSTDLGRTSRALLQISLSRNYPLRIREQAILMQGIIDYVGSEPRAFKVVIHEEEGLTDEMKVNLMLWGPHLESSPKVIA